MTAREWAEAQHVRVYSTLATDHPKIWNDAHLLGWYVRLLMRADPAWPGAAELPRSIPDDVVSALVEDGVVDILEGDLYRFHGLDAERRERQRRGAAGGRARASEGDRDTLGRFAGPSLDDSRSDAGASLDSVAGAVAGPSTQRTPASPPATPARQTDRQPSKAVLSDAVTSRAPARAGARGNGDDEPFGPSPRFAARPKPRPDEIYCEAFVVHGEAGDHQRIADRWRCLTCEKAQAAADPLSFKEKVARASAQRGDDGPF